LTVADQWP